MKTLAAAAAGLALLAGCSVGDTIRNVVAPETPLIAVPSPSPDDDEAIEVVAPEPSLTPSVVMVPGLDGTPSPRASAETIAPRPDLMAAMECEPLSDFTEAQGRAVFGDYPMKPVQVKVGPGTTPARLGGSSHAPTASRRPPDRTESG